MRVYITLLVAVATILASSGAVSAATTSGPTKLVHAASFESVNDAPTGNNDARFLRKRLTEDSDDLSTEERGGLLDPFKKALAVFSSSQRAKNLLSRKVEGLLKENVDPRALKKAWKLLVKKGASKKDAALYEAMYRNYHRKWWASDNFITH